MDYNTLFTEYKTYKDDAFTGRYLSIIEIQDRILNLPNEFQVHKIGDSVENRPIFCTYWGKGIKKILAWSQMHGNETTTTKALLDFVSFLDKEKSSDYVKQLASTCKLALVFVLNPDGAKAYTRVNANQIDLNRDALAATQPEMKALRQLYAAFSPNLCLNLHGQRSIFSAGMQAKPAIVSFLSPSINNTRSINSTRIKSMQLIVEMNQMLQHYIPGQVGRYDDAYNPNCTGDYFQGQDTPTILFEAGHYPEDYEREETRKLIFLAYIKLFESYMHDNYQHVDYKSYFSIPKNEKRYFDWILREINVDDDPLDFAIQYQEVLQNESIQFIPKLVQVNQLQHFYGHQEEKIQGKIEQINGKPFKKTPKTDATIEEINTKNRIITLKRLKK